MRYIAIVILLPLAVMAGWVALASVRDRPGVGEDAVVQTTARPTRILPVRADARAEKPPRPASADPRKFRAFLDGLAPGEWGQFGSSLADFLPNRYREDNGLLGGRNGSKTVVEGWSSGDLIGNRFCFYGGGHTDGANTAFYCLNLSDLSWSRMGDEYPYDATVKVDGKDYPVPSKGPAPTHTYDGLVAAGDKVFVRGNYRFHLGALWWIGPETWVFDINDESWRPVELMKGWAISAYDPKRNILYDEKGAYDPDKLTVLGTYSLPRNTARHYKQLAYDARRDCLWYWFQYDQSAFELYRLERDKAGLVISAPLVATRQSGLSGQTGMDVGPDGRLYFWNDDGAVHAYDPEADKWEAYSAPKFDNGVNPNSGEHSWGVQRVYGKWRYIPDLKIFIGLDGYNQRPIFWRPGAPAPADARSVAGMASGGTGEGDAAPPSSAPAAPEPQAGTAVAVIQPEVKDGVLYFGKVNSGLLPYRLVKSSGNQKAPGWGIPKAMGVAGEHAYIGLVTEYIAQHLAGNEGIWPTVRGQADFDYPWPGGRGYTPSLAHLAHWYWYPYLVTGDTRYLDKLREQVDWAMSRNNNDLISHPNTRGIAWGLVSLAELASVDPEYRDNLEATRKYILGNKRLMPELGYLGQMKEPHQNFSHPKQWQITTWQEAFLLQALAHTVLLGFDEWRPLLESQLTFMRTLYDHDPHWTDTYTDLVLWSRDREVTADNVWEVNGRPSTSASSESRAKYTRAGIAMAAVAGVDGAMDFYREYDAWLKATYPREKWLETKNNVVVP